MVTVGQSEFLATRCTVVSRLGRMCVVLALLAVMGWVGGGAVAIAYVLVSVRRIAPDSTMFQVLNIVGAAMLGVACLYQDALPSAGLNLVWVAVGLRAFATGGARRCRSDSWSSDPDAAPSESLWLPSQATLPHQVSAS